MAWHFGEKRPSLWAKQEISNFRSDAWVSSFQKHSQESATAIILSPSGSNKYPPWPLSEPSPNLPQLCIPQDPDDSFYKSSYELVSVLPGKVSTWAINRKNTMWLYLDSEMRRRWKIKHMPTAFFARIGLLIHWRHTSKWSRHMSRSQVESEHASLSNGITENRLPCHLHAKTKGGRQALWRTSDINVVSMLCWWSIAKVSQYIPKYLRYSLFSVELNNFYW